MRKKIDKASEPPAVDIATLAERNQKARLDSLQALERFRKGEISVQEFEASTRAMRAMTRETNQHVRQMQATLKLQQVLKKTGA